MNGENYNLAECIFCKIVRGDLPSEQVYADEQIYAFYDINPSAPVHVLLIPRQHIERLSDSGAAEQPIFGQLVRTAGQVAGQLGLADSGYRLVVNQGADAGQIIAHLHLHLLGGAELGGLG